MERQELQHSLRGRTGDLAKDAGKDRTVPKAFFSGQEGDRLLDAWLGPLPGRRPQVAAFISGQAALDVKTARFP